MSDNKTYSPVLPFDATFGEYFSTYDTMPYNCDRDRCHPKIAIHSGNIVKYYEYMQKAPVTIPSEA